MADRGLVDARDRAIAALPVVGKRRHAGHDAILDLYEAAEGLREALEPFVDALHHYTGCTDNDYRLHVKGADVRRAREALGVE